MDASIKIAQQIVRRNNAQFLINEATAELAAIQSAK